MGCFFFKRTTEPTNKSNELSEGSMPKSVNKEEILATIKEVAEPLKKYDIYTLRKKIEKALENKRDIKDVVLNSKEVLAAFKDKLTYYFKHGYTNYATELLSLMERHGATNDNISEIINFPKVLAACKDGLTHNLKSGKPYDATTILSLMKRYGITDEKISEIIKSHHVLVACKDGLTHNLKSGKLNNATKILSLMKKYGITDDKISKIINSHDVLVACKDGLTHSLSDLYRSREILSFMKEYVITDEKISKIINSKEVLAAFKDKLTPYLRNGYTEHATSLLSLVGEYGITDEKISEIINSKEVLAAFNDKLTYYLENGYTINADNHLSFMKKYVIIKNSNEVLAAFKDALTHHLEKNNISYATQTLLLMGEYGITDEKISEIINSPEVLVACKDGLTDLLERGKTGGAIEILSLMKNFGITNEKISEIINSPDVLATCKDGLTHELENGDIDDATKLLSLMEKYVITDEKISEIINSPDVLAACKDGLTYSLERGKTGPSIELLSLMEKYVINNKIAETIHNLKDTLELNSIKEMFEQYDNAFLLYVIKNEITDLSFLNYIKKDLDNNFIKKYCLYTIVKEYEDSGSLDFYKDKVKFYATLKKHDSRWQDNTNINKPFEEGVKVFGYDNMFKYLSNKNLDLHDALYNFHKIIDLSNKDPKGNEHFFNNILAQVAKDGGHYNEGSAYNHLNSISNDLENANIQEILENAKKLKSTFPELEGLLGVLQNQENVFSSWVNLKNFMKVKELTQNAKLCEELANLRKEDEALFNYIKPLLFHKDSKVSIDAIMEFWKEPDKFFARVDSIANNIHHRLRPSNFRQYGLSGKELQQAIVKGKLDKEQIIKPYEVIFEVRNISLEDALRSALGKRGVGANAQSPKDIFNKLNKLKISPKDILEGNRTLTDEEKAKVWQILESDPKMATIIKKYKVKAQIHPMQDPFAAIVGDDTACCMPFGAGKLIEYLTNTSVGIFSSSIETPDGNWRTIAQSVLTTDIDIGKQITDGAISNILSENLNDISLESFNKPRVLTCDNIEIARNYSKPEYIKLIEETDKKFFSIYLLEKEKGKFFDTSKVIIGTGYTKALTSLPTIPNTFMPVSLLGYTDNSHDICYELRTDMKPNLDFTILSESEYEEEEVKKVGKFNIVKITSGHSILVGCMENEIYPNGIKNGVIDLQNEINANVILRALYDKPNFMYLMQDSKNNPLGYIIAYERNYNDAQEIYISDFAMLNNKNNKSASGAMLITFLDNYIEAYKDKEKLPPISAEFREGTSYNLIKDEDRLNKMLMRMGLKAKVVEHETEQRDEETFHSCTVYLIKANEDNEKFDEIIKAHQDAKENAYNEYNEDNYDEDNYDYNEDEDNYEDDYDEDDYDEE